MTSLEEAAVKMHELLWNYTGTTDEWMIQFKCDDSILDEFIDTLNDLGDEVEKVKPGSKTWPLQLK